jgi:hypothetical protein
MYVIRLPNGNLQVPRSAVYEGRIMGDMYVEIGPQDPDYARLARQAVTQDEAERRREAWAVGDEALHQEFLEFARLMEDQRWPDQQARPDTPWQEPPWPDTASGPDPE